ncbi:hypothetical protein ACTXT7_016494 [Hymenolepis weldensis]
MSNYPSSSGYGQNPNAQSGFAIPQVSTGLPTLPPGGHPNQGGQMNYLPQGQTGYPQHQQGGQPGFLCQGQMGYPPQGMPPPGYGNANSYRILERRQLIHKLPEPRMLISPALPRQIIIHRWQTMRMQVPTPLLPIHLRAVFLIKMKDNMFV